MRAGAAALAALPPSLVVRHAPADGPAPSSSSSSRASQQRAPPTRRPDGTLSFPDAPAAFRPTLSPEEVLRAGAFGGGYFRTIASRVTGRVHVDAWRELPAAWVAGLVPAKALAAPRYDPAANKYGVRSGQDLRDWEEQGWIAAQDPFGW